MKRNSKKFDRIARWAQDRRVSPSRIILGEFGTRRQEGLLGALRSAERARWIEAEAHGFIWAVWVYRGMGGFCLLRDEESSDLDPCSSKPTPLRLLRKPLRGFLGLNPRCGASTRFHQGFDKC